MNESQLRAYAVRGLTSRLAELDRERVSIQALLAQWTEPAAPRRTMSEDARRRIGEATRRRWSERRAPGRGAVTPTTHDTASEVARVLPRRGDSLRRKDAVPAAPTLPPMPRLIKKAS